MGKDDKTGVENRTEREGRAEGLTAGRAIHIGCGASALIGRLRTYLHDQREKLSDEEEEVEEEEVEEEEEVCEEEATLSASEPKAHNIVLKNTSPRRCAQSIDPRTFSGLLCRRLDIVDLDVRLANWAWRLSIGCAV